MIQKKGVLPVFIPFVGCPKRCIYCDQNSITDIKLVNFEYDVENQLKYFLQIKRDWSILAFYGGSFNLLNKTQRLFLYDLAKKYKFNKIRVSCYPSGFDNYLIDEFHKHDVAEIELGVQSFSDKVIEVNGRDYSCDDVIGIINRLKSEGFRVGIQIMVGMYGEKLDDVKKNVEVIRTIDFDYFRIYPTVVFENTKLANYKNNLKFSFEEVIAVSSIYYLLASYKGATVLRVGLHNNSNFQNKIVGGYFHPSFGDIIMTFVIYLYLRINEKNRLCRNFPNYKRVIVKSFDVIYDKKITFSEILKTVWSEYFENNRWEIKGEIFDLAKEFWCKANE
ncbi:radical SAM protein [Deferribacter thermophilus]|uniref:radical SAM protein n=1 Tax=Deferribacter thermophilus TaxID=53573 RepID=UPI003C1F1329